VAFLRKHRQQYWLVHNFRVHGKVRQVRLYAFDLHADLDHEIERARSTVASRFDDHIPATWVEPVRHKLRQLQRDLHHEQHTRQLQQARQRLTDFLQALDSFRGSPDDRTWLLQDCLHQLQQRLAQRTAGSTSHPPAHHAPRDAVLPGEATTPAVSLGQGFYLRGRVISHACQARHPSENPLPPGSRPAERAPVVCVALINGRDLWIECLVCHARWTDMSRLDQLGHLNIHRQRISKFERFCSEHTVGASCFILQYRSGRVARLSGTVQDIDYASRKVTVACAGGTTHQTYERHFTNVYFGLLEVRLTVAQQKHIAASGQTGLTHLGDNWYALTDTPDIRLLLQQQGIRY
jgi:hypothetical protein